MGLCEQWSLAGLRGWGAAVLWRWWALVGVVLLVCPGGLGVGWSGVTGPGSRPGCRALLAGVLAGPPGLSWSYWPDGCRGRVIPPVPAGVTGSGYASDAPPWGMPGVP